MPIYNYHCKKCDKPVRCMAPKVKVHRECGGDLERTPEGAAAQQLDTIDNGLMVRRVERLTNMEELAHERAQNDPRITRFQND